MTKPLKDGLWLEFGALSAPLAKQIPDLEPAACRHFQRDADAITRLSVRGLITERGATNARRRLIKNIAAVLSPKATP